MFISPLTYIIIITGFQEAWIALEFDLPWTSFEMCYATCHTLHQCFANPGALAKTNLRMLFIPPTKPLLTIRICQKGGFCCVPDHELSILQLSPYQPFCMSFILSSATVHMTHSLARAVPLGSISRWSRVWSIWMSRGMVVRSRLRVRLSRSMRKSEKRNATPLFKSSTQESDSTSWCQTQTLRHDSHFQACKSLVDIYSTWLRKQK